MNLRAAKCFVIKSYHEDDVHKAVKYGVWASTEQGNRRLDRAYKEMEGKGPILLFFSVNASGQFCGIAQMASPVDFQSKFDCWLQDKWTGQFRLRWIFIKDVPNNELRHIILENNEGKPVTHSRDTQEIPLPKAREVLKVFVRVVSRTSILDDFGFYDKRQEQIQKRAERAAQWRASGGKGPVPEEAEDPALARPPPPPRAPMQAPRSPPKHTRGGGARGGGKGSHAGGASPPAAAGVPLGSASSSEASSPDSKAHAPLSPVAAEPGAAPNPAPAAARGVAPASVASDAPSPSALEGPKDSVVSATPAGAPKEAVVPDTVASAAPLTAPVGDAVKAA